MSTIHMDETLLRQIVREEVKILLPVTEKFMNADEAAAYLSYSLHSVYRLTSKKILPHYKNSGMLLFKESELLEYITKGKQSS